MNDFVIPFIRADWKREWLMEPEQRLPRETSRRRTGSASACSASPKSSGACNSILRPRCKPSQSSQQRSRARFGLADKLVQNWKVSERFVTSPRVISRSAGFRAWFGTPVSSWRTASRNRVASDRWLPYNVPEAAMHTKAVLAGDKWVINGRKQFISNGYDASLYAVYANTKPGVGMLQGTSSFLVPRDTPGLIVNRCNETMGGRFMNNGEIVFEDCRVPKDHLLVEGDALSKAGVYFCRARSSKRQRTWASVWPRSNGPRSTCRAMSRWPHADQAPGSCLAARRHGDEAERRTRSPVEAARAVDDGAADADQLCNMVKVFASEEIFEVRKHAMELHGAMV